MTEKNAAPARGSDDLPPVPGPDSWSEGEAAEWDPSDDDTAPPSSSTSSTSG